MAPQDGARLHAKVEACCSLNRLCQEETLRMLAFERLYSIALSDDRAN